MYGLNIFGEVIQYLFPMKNTTKQVAKKNIKVRLDNRTVITISRMSSLKVWLERFPEAKVIAN